MPYSTIIITILVAFSCGSIFAQPLDETRKSGVSGITFYLSNTGVFGHNTEELKGGFTAMGSYMYGSGLFFAAKKIYHDSLLKLGFWTYNPRYAKSDATPGDLRASTENQAASAKIYRSVDFDRTTGNVLSGQSISPKWPLWLTPGAESTPMSPGTFVYNVDERTTAGGIFSGPAFVAGPDEQFVARFHDGDTNRYTASEGSLYGMPMGLQFEQNVFGWNWGPFSNVVVLKYDVVNISEDDLIECAIGQLADIDIQQQGNDYFDCYTKRPELRIAYGWSGREGLTRSRALLMIQLEGPVAGADGYVDNTRRQEYRAAGRLGACRGWKNVGGNRIPNRENLYDFAGDYQPWPEGVGDVLGMIGTRYFSMHPGDTAHYAMAFALIDSHPDSSTWDASIDSLVPLLIDRYYDRFLPAAVPPEKSGDPRLTLLSSSERNHLRVRFSAGSDVTLLVHDLLGEEVATLTRRMYDGEIAEETIDMSASSPGIYLVELRSGGKREVIKVMIGN
jgi:hypothetical protein